MNIFTKSPKVTIALGTYNEERNIENFCKSVQDQTYKNIELVIVDSERTTDKTSQLAKKYTDKVYTYGRERSVQRNHAVKHATGKYVLILDCDMMLTPNVVEECVDTIEKDHDLKAITIPEKSIGENFWAKCKAFERSFYNMEQDDLTDAARFFEKKVFDEFGGYDESLTGAEDWDLPERIYKKFPKRKKISSLIIHNEGNVSLWGLMKKKHFYALDAHVYLDNHQIGMMGPKTLYFLRPVFYKRWYRWFSNPLISLGTIVMLSGELIAGGLGFVQGKFFGGNKLSKKDA